MPGEKKKSGILWSLLNTSLKLEKVTDVPLVLAELQLQKRKNLQEGFSSVIQLEKGTQCEESFRSNRTKTDDSWSDFSLSLPRPLIGKFLIGKGSN